MNYTSKFKNWLASDRKIRKTVVSLDYRFFRRRRWEGIMNLDTKGKFTEIYKHNLWNNEESRSGACSTMKRTANVRKGLQSFLVEQGIRSICDAGCGDFNWMKAVDLGGIRYHGIDIVEDLIRANTKRYERENITFRALDLIHDDLPRVDLILCREVLLHLSFEDVLTALSNFKKSQSKFLLTTHYPGLAANEDTRTGKCHLINFRAAPVNLGAPLRMIEEDDFDHGLAVWKLEDIRLDRNWQGWAAA